MFVKKLFEVALKLDCILPFTLAKHVFAAKRPVHHKPFTLSTPNTFAPNTFGAFTPGNLYIKQLCRKHPAQQKIFTSNIFHTREPVHYTNFAQGNLYIKPSLKTGTFYAQHLLHQTRWWWWWLVVLLLLLLVVVVSCKHVKKSILTLSSFKPFKVSPCKVIFLACVASLVASFPPLVMDKILYGPKS